MTLDELLTLLRNPPEGGLPETIYDDIDNAVRDLVDGSTAKVLEMQTAQEAQQAELLRLKAFNFDLLTASGTESSGVDTSDIDNTVDATNIIEFALENEEL